jgi:hypothetical protein
VTPTKEQTPKLLHIESGLLNGKRHPDIEPEHLFHHPRIDWRQVAQVHPRDDGLYFGGTQRDTGWWLLQN